jgi:pimeloyl-ACP methyl ester carboxylesterase
MPTTRSPDGTDIFFEEVGTGPILVLLHGFLGNGANWERCGYLDALKQSFRLLIMDARGHGKSGKPREPEAYYTERRVEDVVAVVESAGGGPAAFWGYSMGGRAGFGCMADAPEMFERIIVGGIHVLDENHESFSSQFEERAKLLDEGMAALVNSMPNLTQGQRENMLKQDARALAACTRGVAAQAGLTEKVRNLKGHALVYAGSDDPVFDLAKQSVQYLTNAAFLELKGLNHGQGFTNSSAILPHALEFLKALQVKHMAPKLR